MGKLEDLIKKAKNYDDIAMIEIIDMVVQTQAYDVFSAAHFSIIGLSEVLNTLSFFTAIESWSVSDISLIVYNTQSPYTKSLKATDVYRTYEYLDSSSKVYERAERIISPKGHCGHPLRQKLLSSFSYANLSRASMALEEKYMNICLCGPQFLEHHRLSVVYGAWPLP